jgi:lipoprotein signal peptidase
VGLALEMFGDYEMTYLLIAYLVSVVLTLFVLFKEESKYEVIYLSDALLLIGCSLLPIINIYALLLIASEKFGSVKVWEKKR